MKIKLNGKVIERTKGLMIATGVTVMFGTLLCLGMDIRYKSLKADYNALERLRINDLEKTDAIIIRSNEIEVELASCSAKLQPQKTQPKTFKGKVSYYDHENCLGCSTNQITASGEPFDENKYTMALPLQWTHIKLPTTMTVTNLDNGKTITVRANDRHGAYNAKYGWRVADLSKAAYIALGAKTDISTLEFVY